MVSPYQYVKNAQDAHRIYIDTSFQQYGWVQGEAGWTVQEQWPDMNAQAGVGCYSWGPGTVSYVFMLDLEDNLNIFWKGDSFLSGCTTESNSAH